MPHGGTRDQRERMALGFSEKTAVFDANSFKGQGGGLFLTRR